MGLGSLKALALGYLHLELLIGHASRAAPTTTWTVATVLVIILLRVLMATRKAPATHWPGQCTPLQIQVLLACVRETLSIRVCVCVNVCQCERHWASKSKHTYQESIWEVCECVCVGGSVLACVQTCFLCVGNTEWMKFFCSCSLPSHESLHHNFYVYTKSSTVSFSHSTMQHRLSRTLSFSRSSLICWCSCSVSSWSPSRSYLAKMASISASVCPFLQDTGILTLITAFNGETKF